MPTTNLTRRQLLKIGAVSVGATMSLLSACVREDASIGTLPDTSSASDEEEIAETTHAADGDERFAEAEYGGTLRVALIDEPPTLDIHQTTAANTALVGWHIYEALFTWDSELQPIPELTESYEVTADGLVHYFYLRADRLFHDERALSAEDVAASIRRWGDLTGLGRSVLDTIAEFEIVHQHLLAIHLTEPFGTLQIALARQNQGCAIIPARLIEESSEGPLREHIGTGPYRFAEHVPDRHIRLERFDRYVSAETRSDGYGGGKHRFLDQIEFIAVNDEAARIAGLKAGDYHVLESISPDHFDDLDADPDINAELSEAYAYPNLVFNLSSPVMQDQRIRRSIQIALNHQPIMQAGYGEGFFRLDPSLLTVETPWHTLAGAEFYDQHDLSAAHDLLEDLGYDDAPIRFMVTQAYRDLYNASLVIAQQMEDIGLNVSLEVFDWSTLVERRDSPDIWDLYLTLATFRPDPIMRNLTCEAPGWWCDPEKDDRLKLVQTLSDFDERYAVWEEIQKQYYEQIPRIKIGDTFPVIARSARLGGFPELTQLQPVFWNSWLRGSSE